MHQPHAQRRQRLGEQRCGLFGSLRLQGLGLFDQGAHPVGLTALAAALGDSGDDLIAALVGNHHGLHGRAARRQLINHRQIKIGISGHRQGARDRRGGHDQLMRGQLFALAAQRQALVHAETMLFIDDHQAKVFELHIVLKQGMGADHHFQLALKQLLQNRLALLALVATAEPADLKAERLEPLHKVVAVLLGQQFGGCHQRNLIARFDHVQRSQCRNHGLAATDITLHQAHHRMTLLHVGQHLLHHALLCAGQLERQIILQAAGQRIAVSARRDRRRSLLAMARAQQAQAQLVRQQLFKGQTLLRRVALFGQQQLRGLRRRAMQQGNRFGQRGQLELL